jgi:hypothetical protein
MGVYKIMEVTINCSDLEPRPCASGIELAEGLILVGTEDELLDALRKVADVLGECGADVAPRDPGPEALTGVGAVAKGRPYPPPGSDADLAARAFGVSDMTGRWR